MNVPNAHIIIRVLKKKEIKRRTAEEAADLRCNINIDIDKMINLYESGKPSTEIAKIFNTTSSTILIKLKKNNIRIKSPNEYHTKRKPYTEEQRKNLVNRLMGHSVSKETRLKLSEARMGEKNPMYGKIVSEETRRKLSKVHKGEKSYLWKGGVTLFRHGLRTCFEYRQWRSDIFTKDNFTCQECGQIGKRLHAHHIEAFSSIIQKYEITTIQEALECEELWNINNGITLCEKCHKELKR
jgi:hypothetical protein